MSNKVSGLLRFRRAISITLGFAFVLYSLFVINFRIFIDTPAIGFNHVFIGDAKPYYFELSNIFEKNLEFSTGSYEGLWLSLPNVTEVVTSDELPSSEFWETTHIWSVTIDGQAINIFEQNKTDLQARLYDETLERLSAAAWSVRVNSLIWSLIKWVCLTILIIAWIVYLDKTTGVLF